MNTDEKSKPRVARFKPFYFKPVPGKTYHWCACGRSATQPFCDGSHAGTEFQPLKYVAGPAETEVLLCGCKHSQMPPFCDGSHNNLRTVYESDDPNSETNRGKVQVVHHRDGRFELNGSCYVSRVNQVAAHEHGNLLWRAVVTSESGAQYQSLFAFEIRSGLSPVIAFGAVEVVLFVTDGAGEIEISGRKFALSAHSGIYVRRGETFRINNPAADPVRIFASVCPQMLRPVLDGPMLMNFDAAEPNRSVAVDDEKNQAMGDRSFQLLVNKEVGSRLVTQFIGNIPLSKAAPHRHLYDEALFVLSGQGMMWTEDLKTPVRAADVVFLPSKQVHSLQCTDEKGMRIVGVIYPGGNPNINY
jgi:CDGSH-type Zn-finger protein/mannose-6-phosphate isomerase-like protein (cupin superfamily)